MCHWALATLLGVIARARRHGLRLLVAGSAAAVWGASWPGRRASPGRPGPASAVEHPKGHKPAILPGAPPAQQRTRRSATYAWLAPYRLRCCLRRPLESINFRLLRYFPFLMQYFGKILVRAAG